MNQLRAVSAGRRRSSPERPTDASPLQPYSRLPFTPSVPRANKKPCPPRMPVRKTASRQIEQHFGQQHTRYKNRQNNHSSKFKISTKKTPKQTLGDSQSFWLQKLHQRGKDLRQLHEHYLLDVTAELQRPKEWQLTQTQWNSQQKTVGQYNIIYEYRAEKIPLGFLL